MVAHPVSAALWLVGAIAIIVGLLAAGGVVSLSTTATGSAAAVAGFSWTTANQTVTVTLHNTVPSLGSGLGTGIIKSPVAASCASQLYFGDNSAPNTNASPIKHTYVAAGAYTIEEVLKCSNGVSIGTTTLTVAGQARVPGTGVGSVATGSLNGNAYVVPSFKVAANLLNLTVTDTSQGFNESIQSISWNFGDGAGSASEAAGTNFTHLYTKPGTYQVSETVTGGAFSVVPPSAPSVGSPSLIPGKYYVNSSVTVTNGLVQPPIDTNPLLNAPASGAHLGPSVYGVLAFGILMVIGGFLATTDPKHGAMLGGLGGLAAGILGYILTGGPL